MVVSGHSHAPAALYPGKGPPVSIVQEAGWTPEPVWTQRLEEKSFASARDRTPVVQSVVSKLTELPKLLLADNGSVKEFISVFISFLPLCIFVSLLPAFLFPVIIWYYSAS
jgi:hypothetical protein